jgi:type VI secretion system protein ImpJ
MTQHRHLRNNVIDPVQWHEGMLLGPHHFQQNDLRIQHVLTYHVERLSPFFWGVARLHIDPVFLLQGVVRIRDLEAIMPDGSLIHVLENDAIPDLKISDFHNELLRRPLMLYLAIAAYRPGIGNACGPTARYESRQGHPVVDENTGDNPIVLPRWRTKLHLVVGELPSERYISLPIAEFMIREGAYALSPYIPPHLSVEIQSSLGEICAGVFQRIREKIAFLIGPFKDVPQAAMPEDTIRNIQILTAALVPCETTLYSSPNVHPLIMYQALCHLAGRLAALRCTSMPPIFEAYQHDKIRQCFEAVTDYIYSILTTVEDRYESLTFTLNQRFFELAPHPVFNSGRLVVGLRTPASSQDEDIVQWIRDAVIIKKSGAHMAQERRILGAKRRLIEHDDLIQVSSGKGLVLCEITGDASYFNAGEPLLIFNMSDRSETRPQDIIMYLAKGSDLGGLSKS